ncbi:hypothetical protein FO440_15570 [Mucilaginibacter corticis]|uniref:SH3 domain-containing protein n=1 Tax=Mucilaginibacter corticis TaxID=2597670 RepID=A0A556MGY3_9SPHI|nr:hypothetical protein [Mucilaginibacter corticis]TSJ39181.1 hypothetical protein FO440_15570 [Mucilaginibacter corticis]
MVQLVMAGLKKISTSLKVVLSLLALLAVAYTVNLFTGHKQVILADTDTIAVSHPLQKLVKHHRNKQHAQRPSAIKEIDHTPKIVQLPATQTKPEIIKPSLRVALQNPESPKSDTLVNTNNFIYTTYVQPNVTGVVKLRDQDNFYANTLTNIPANSKVQVLKRGQTYYQVAYNHTIGFVPKWTLKTK